MSTKPRVAEYFEFEEAAQAYLRSLPPEHFMEATDHAHQRKIVADARSHLGQHFGGPPHQRLAGQSAPVRRRRVRADHAVGAFHADVADLRDLHVVEVRRNLN